MRFLGLYFIEDNYWILCSPFMLHDKDFQIFLVFSALNTYKKLTSMLLLSNLFLLFAAGHDVTSDIWCLYKQSFGRNASVRWGTRKDANEKAVPPSLFSLMRTEIPEMFPAGVEVVWLSKLEQKMEIVWSTWEVMIPLRHLFLFFFFFRTMNLACPLYCF